MAKREALRELQARLAKRLQGAPDASQSVAWLAVRCAASPYLLPLAQAGEIMAWTPVHAVPYTQAWFKGVVNVRGNLVGVADLAAFIAACRGAAAVAPASAPTGPAPAPEASVITLNRQYALNCALRVDSLAGLRGPDAFVSRSPPPPGAPAFFGDCLQDAEGTVWQEIQLQALARFEPFLRIAA